MKDVDQVRAQERSYQHRKLPIGENRTIPGPPGWGFCTGLASLSCKTTIATETQQKTSNTISHVMIDDERTPRPVTTSGQSHQDARGLNSSKRNSPTKNNKTTKTSIQKQPKNSTAKQISEMVTDTKMKQNKKDLQNYTKKCLYGGTAKVTTLVSNSSKMHLLFRTLDHYRLDILGIAETHASLR